jgi:hypothetical protein
MLAVLLWALANCLLGYFAFRVLLVVDVAVAGALFGQTVAEAFTNQPSSLDYLVACGGLAAVAAICGWLFPRPVFRTVGGLAIGSGVLLLGGGRLGSGLVVLAVIAALSAGTLCYVYFRRMVLYLTGGIGSICAVFAAASLLGWTSLPAGALALLLVLLATGLSVVGIYCQVFLARRITHSMAPKPVRKRRRSRSATRVHPRFTKI